MVRPPLTERVCPVMKEASSEARKAIAAAISSGLASLRNGMALTRASPSLGLAFEVAAMSGVYLWAGQTTFTRRPWRAVSRATPLEKPMIPALAPEYTPSPLEPTRPASELTLTMRPDRREIIPYRTDRVQSITPLRLTAMLLSQVSSELSG